MINKYQLGSAMFMATMATVASYWFATFCGAWALLIWAILMTIVWATVLRFAKPESSATMEDEGVLLLIVYILGLVGCWFTVHPAVTIVVFVLTVLAAIENQRPEEKMEKETAM